MLTKSEIRKDYLMPKYVIITPSRSKRPRDIKEATIVEYDQKCYFCPGEMMEQNFKDGLYIKHFGKNKKNWDIMILKNKFPALSMENPKAYGAQEVIIENPKHNLELGQMKENEIRKVLKAYQDRATKLSKLKNIEYVLIFKNKGSKAGASLTHAHAQMFATDILPFNVYEELKLTKKYKIKNKNCFYCNIIKKEIKSERKIFEDKFIAVFAPYASQYHYEAWIFTKRHTDNITTLNKNEINSLAKALKLILKKLKKYNLSYNFFTHNILSDDDQHFCLKIQPRDSIWAGVELGSGIIINSVPPETAAKFYREK